MAKLLQGNTHLLQPLNLLPNSDFLRGGGYSATQTNVLVGYDLVSLAYGWAMCTQAAAAKGLCNIEVTKNSIHIWGHYIKHRYENVDPFGSIFAFRIQNTTFSPKTNSIYTVFCKLQDNLNHITNPRVSFTGSNNVYKRDVTHGYLLDILKPGSSDNRPAVYVNIADNTDFDFVISDFVCYEGAFTNPPVYPSIDRMGFGLVPTLSNLYSGVGLQKGARLGSRSPSRWLRMVKLPYSSGQNYQIKLQIMKLHEASEPITYDIHLQYFCNTTAGKIRSATCEAVCGLSSGRNSIPSFRIARDNENNMYFEVYWNDSGAAPWLICRILNAESNQYGFVNFILSDILLLTDGTEDIALTKEFGHRVLGYENSDLGVSGANSKGAKWVRMLKIDGAIAYSINNARYGVWSSAWTAKVIFLKGYHSGSNAEHAYAYYIIEMGGALGSSLNQNHLYLDVKTSADNNGSPFAKWRFAFDKPASVPTVGTSFPMYLEGYYSNTSAAPSAHRIVHIYDTFDNITAIGFDDSYVMGQDAPGTSYAVTSEIVPTRVGTTVSSPNLVS